MTGQVKESVIMRRGELGVRVKNASVVFEHAFLRSDEFDEHGKIEFSICGIVCRYKKAHEKGVKIHRQDNIVKLDDYALPQELSQEIFMRSDDIKLIEILV